MSNQISPVSSHNENVDDEYHLQRTSAVMNHSDMILDLVSDDELDDSRGSLDLDCHPTKPQQEISRQRQSRVDEKKRARAQQLASDMALKDMTAKTAAKQQLFPKQKQQLGKGEGKESYRIGSPEHPRPQSMVLKPFAYPSSQEESIENCDEKPKARESISSGYSDSGELVKQMKPAVLHLSDAILALVNADEGESQDILDEVAKRQALSSGKAAIGIACLETQTVYKSAALASNNNIGPHEMKKAFSGYARISTTKETFLKPLPKAKRAVSGSTGRPRSRSPDRKYREAGQAAVRRGAEDDGSDDEIAGIMVPNEPARDGRLQAQPGAMRVPGFGGGDDDDNVEDSAFFSVTGKSKDDAGAAVAPSASLVSEDPIQAVLVDDSEEFDEEKERELAEREARIRERELELELKMQRMAENRAVAVQALVVSAEAATETKKKKKKGWFGLFKSRAKKAEAQPQAKRPSVTTQLLSTKTDESASSLVNQYVEKQLGTSPIATHEAPTAFLAGFAEQLTKKQSHSTKPLFERHEIQVGKKVGKGKVNEVVELQRLTLDEAWDYPLSHRAGLSLEDREKQSDLRKDLVCQSAAKGRPYVVKYLRSDLEAKRRDYASRELVYEACLLANLNHPNIIQLAGMSEGSLSMGHAPNFSFFFIMDQLQDNLLDRLTKSWRRKIRNPQFFLDRVKVASDLASAIDYLHSLNIMCGDLKPENVGFDRDGTLKLFNFGVAKALTQGKQPYDTSCYTTTPHVGTHPYVAPEVALRRPSGISVDTYAFGILVWEIMTIKEPFADLMIHEYTEKVIQRQKRPRLDRKTPAELNDLMSACWDHDPYKRPIMRDVHVNLLKFQEQLDVPQAKKGFFR